MYQLCIKGDWGKWSDWSECSADCSLGKSHGEKMRQRSLRNAPFRDPDVQIQPCSKRCPPGDIGQFHDQTYMFSFRLHKPKGQPPSSVKRCCVQDEHQPVQTFQPQFAVFHYFGKRLWQAEPPSQITNISSKLNAVKVQNVSFIE